MFTRVLIANRGEIARRITRTCRRLGIEVVAVFSDADAGSLHVAEADHAVRIGPDSAASSYLDAERILTAAIQSGADAVHPGYGFLSESAEFAHAVINAGLAWIGPPPDAITTMGDKAHAKECAAAAGVPVARGASLPLLEPQEALPYATQIGFPIMIKPSGGGGGIGMAVAVDEDDFMRAWNTAVSRTRSLFTGSSMLLERYIPRARHIEIQILGLQDGRVVAIGERDCSVQRRHQKVAEECPSPALSSSLRTQMCEAAIALGQSVGYRGAGTVEFLLDRDTDDFMFLEMNTRLQVEHPVTEAVFGIDLVEAQLRIAAGEALTCDPDDLIPRGHAFEFRIYAEDPVTFLPGPGLITRWIEPRSGVRVDSGYGNGDRVTHFYDPLMAKLCVWAATRDEALAKSKTALSEFVIEGPKSNLPFFDLLLSSPTFASGDYGTSLLADLQAESQSVH